MRRVVVRLTVLVFLLAVVVAAVVGGAAFWLTLKFDRPGPAAAALTVIIPPGTSVDEIGKQLQSAGAVESGKVFAIGARIYGRRKPLEAGEYAVPAHASARDIMLLLQSGRTVVHRFTVPEGLTSAQIVRELDHAEALSGPPPDIPPDGSLLPETYHYSYGDTRAEMLRRMHRAMDETVARLWKDRAAGLPYKSPEDAVILASIIEKETGVPEERAHIAAVFINRLKKGMRLQSDPTVVYALTNGSGPLDRPLTKADLEVKSPYNTYEINGLPPGPISNPGRDSIYAALHPSDSDDLYFVASGSGGHVFAKTLAQHNGNVAKYRRMEAEEAHSSSKTSGESGGKTRQ